jgi:hypothetical protein
MLEKQNGLQMSQVFFRVRALSPGGFAFQAFYRARPPRPTGIASSATSISLDLADLRRGLARLAL